jgi:hypothetical protein
MKNKQQAADDAKRLENELKMIHSAISTAITSYQANSPRPGAIDYSRTENRREELRRFVASQVIKTVEQGERVLRQVREKILAYPDANERL